MDMADASSGYAQKLAPCCVQVGSQVMNMLHIRTEQ
jgi:hypothetical protein